MIISVDYDSTYSADPATFNIIIQTFQAAGHTVICCTGRDVAMGQEVLDSIGKLVGESNCVFAGKNWKRDAATAAGFDVDVWIDDMPEMVARQVLVLGGWSSD